MSCAGTSRCLGYAAPTQLSYVMSGYRYFVCPVEFNNDLNSFQVDCSPSELFQLQEYALPAVLRSVSGWVRGRHLTLHLG